MRSWKLSVPLALLGLGSSLVTAFPSEEMRSKMGVSGHSHGKRCPFGHDSDQVQKRANPNVPIDISGEHAFQPPDYENGDVRGLCPGLNALANHGYLPHNGVASISELITAVNQVYGMGVDLATVLATTSTIWGGNPLSLNPSVSLGGATPKVSNLLGNLGGLLGEPQGLNGLHNFLEADASNTREDLYVNGDNFRLQMDLYKEWEEMSPDGIFSIDLMAKRAKMRFDQSVQTNPYFYSGPVTGLVAGKAAYLVGARLFANYSDEHPNGVYTKENIRAFFGVYEEGDELVYKEGWERIPENLYPTPVEWGVARLNMDLVNWVTQYPELASIGGNTGTVNSFTGVDLGDLTGGAINLTTLLEGNNLLCFIFQALKLASPNALAGLYKVIAVPLEMLTDALSAPMLDLACPAFDDLQLKMGGEKFWQAAQNKFPGAKKSGSAL